MSDQNALEALAELSEVDKEVLRQIKIKQVSGLHNYYSNLREQIITSAERVSLYYVMIERNHIRLGTRNDTEIPLYEMDKKISLKSALADQENIINKIEEYKDILKQLQSEEKILKDLRDDLADKVDDIVTLDGLTKLYKRDFFKRRVIEEIARSIRTGEEFLIFMSDIDHFGEYNNTYGHQAGDEALKAVSKTLDESIREGDIGVRQGDYENESGRYGGEEFIFRMHNIKKEEVEKVLDRIRENIESTRLPEYDLLDPEVNTYGLMTPPTNEPTGYDSTKVTVSIGGVYFNPAEFTDISAFRHLPKEDAFGKRLDMPENEDDIRPAHIYTELVRRCDKAMYAAKRAGRNCVREYNSGMENGKNEHA